jgi:hypothetical protein
MMRATAAALLFALVARAQERSLKNDINNLPKDPNAPTLAPTYSEAPTAYPSAAPSLPPSVSPTSYPTTHPTINLYEGCPRGQKLQ